jgi:hypothetical protein
MATTNPATTNIKTQKTVTATAVAISRGARLLLNTNGLVSVAGITIVGDYVALQDIAASGVGLAAPIGAGGSVPMLASENCTVGAAAYSAASGKTSKTSTNAVILGKWLQAPSTDTLGVVELGYVA